MELLLDRRAQFQRRAARWAEKHGKPIVGNSDLHDLRQLGRTYSRVFAEPDADAICQAIRDGRVSLQTSPVPKSELARVLMGMGWRDLNPREASRRRLELSKSTELFDTLS